VVTVTSLSSTTGGGPQSSLLVEGNLAYFTTTSGGTDSTGTIAEIDLTSGQVTPLYSFPSSLVSGSLPNGNLIKTGNDLYILTTAGGTRGQGAAIKYSLTSGIATTLTNFYYADKVGIQPFGGLVQAGTNYYFTTLQGGSTVGSVITPTITLPDGSTKTVTVNLTLGAGTLSQLSFDGSGNPVIAPTVSLPGGWEQFPSSAPTVVGNSLYFLSSGVLYPLVTPGAILRYDLDTGIYTSLYKFSTNPVPGRAYGLQPGYSSPTEWQGDLYFINHHGGTNATILSTFGGTLVKFNLATSTLTKLADFTNNTPGTGLTGTLGAPNTANGVFASGTVVQETNRFFLYYPLPGGGDNGKGTIIRVYLPPQPIQSQLALNGSTDVTLSWTGGYPPFDVLTNSDLSSSANWAPIVTGITSNINTTNWSVPLPLPGNNLFYRVQGQAH
jgi:hypothetical protein